MLYSYLWKKEDSDYAKCKREFGLKNVLRTESIRLIDKDEYKILDVKDRRLPRNKFSNTHIKTI